MFLKILLLQSTTAAADSLTQSKMASQSMLDIILNSGTFGILIVLIQLILTFIAVYIFAERYAAIKRASRIDLNFMNNIRVNVQSGNIAAARALCQNNDSPVARMVEKGLQRIGKPLRDIDAAIENVGNLEVFKLEKNLATLASISGAAPMLGFLGTVTGMILAFYQMSTAETITPALLAGGIYQALLTTAFGLGVGIFALIGYNLLVANIDKIVYQMEQSTIDFMDFLQEPTM
jgi:biopolymer transport protein ExbB